MHIIIDKEKIVSSLAKVQSIVERRSALPILEHVRVRIAEGSITLTTTDMDIMVSDAFPVNSELVCSFTTPVQPLYEIVRKLYGCEQITIDFNEEESLLTITGGAGRFNLSCLSDDGFPSFDETLIDEVTLTLPAESLHSLLFQTRHAISSGETRYYLNGAYFHQKDPNHLTVVATDAHRLAKSELDLANLSGLSVGIDEPSGTLDIPLTSVPSVIIPRKTVLELIKLLEANKGTQVNLWVSERKIKVKIGNTIIISKLIEAKFPDYQAPLSQITSGREVVIKVKELIKAIDLVVSVLEDKVKKVKLKFEKNELTISVENQISHHASGIQRVPIKYDDDKIEILLNAKYLTDCLAVIRGENALITLNSSTHPMIIKDREEGSSLYVLMPMQLSDGDTTHTAH